MNAKTNDLSNAIIELQNVRYHVPNSTGSRPVLDGISLTIHPGETIVLLGRSGSGKTTLLKLVNGLRASTSGQVIVEGRPVPDWDLIRLRRRIGYVIQEIGLFPHWTVRQNVLLLPEIEGWPAERSAARFEEVMRSVAMNAAEYAGRYPRELSGGQRQRIGVARALAADPAILLMDEPFGAVDPVTRAELQREFLAVVRSMSKTVVFVTHDVREALLLGTRIVLLHEGRIAAESAPDDFVRLEHPVAREFLAAAELSAGACT